MINNMLHIVGAAILLIGLPAILIYSLVGPL